LRTARLRYVLALRTWIGLSLGLGVACISEAELPTDDTVRQLLLDGVEQQQRAPGIVVGLLDRHGNRILSFGSAGSGSSVKLDGDTVFEIGSATKTFTGILLEIFIQRGEVRLEDPAQKYLPATVKMPSRNGKQIALLDLATHTSGLPRLPSNFKPKDPANPYADYTIKQLYEFISGCSLERDPGEKYEYSNLGMGLLGHILARNAGVDYETLVVREICAPLKMDSTRITLTPALKARLAPGHNSAGVAVANWDLPTLAGAGAIRSSANDMLKYLTANLRLPKCPLTATMAETHKPRASAGKPEMSIGLAWHIRKEHGSEIVWHNGGTGGYHSFIGFEPKQQQGVVVLANSETSIDDLALHLLNPEFKLETKKARQIAKVDPALYEQYAGRYEFAPGVLFTFTRQGDHLMAQLTGQPAIEVYPQSTTNFFYTMADAQLTFVKSDGKVTAVILHQNGQDQTATKIK
jgi:serine-type D-Ala-D-Ala carboxypeptidase/endopeptidase